MGILDRNEFNIFKRCLVKSFKNVINWNTDSDFQNKKIKQLTSDLEKFILFINEDFVYQELDEKIMLGLRLREGIDIYKVFKEQNWENKKFESNLRKLLEEWEKYIESGLLVRKGNRFFLSDPKGMELSNQILISMFKWWDEIN